MKNEIEISNQKDEYSIDLNSFIVLESLEGDKKSEQTGIALYNDVIQYTEFKIPEFKDKVKYYEFKSKAKFFEILDEIIQLIREGYRPMIHLECHGQHPEGNGLIVSPSDEFIEWSEIESRLRTMNILMKNSLFITFAVCKGGNIQDIIDVEKPAPFFSLIGSEQDVYPKDIYKSYSKYYQTLIFEKDLLKALNTIRENGTFKIWGTQFLYRHFEDELIQFYYKDSLESAVKKKLRELQRKKGVRLSKKERVKMRKEFLQIRKEIVKEKVISLRNRFLMLDKYPELENRYRKLNYNEYCG